MRVNVYAEEMTDQVEIITKKIGNNEFTAVRFWLQLPASFVQDNNSVVTGEGISPLRPASPSDTEQAVQFQAPFIHHPGDDDSSAVTFWGKKDLRVVLRKALAELDAHYAKRDEARRRQSLVGPDPGGEPVYDPEWASRRAADSVGL